jgi:hypothetical protein
MRVTVFALSLVVVSAGRLRAPPVNKGAVHDEDKAVAKSTSKAISKHEPVAKEVVHKNGTKPAAKVVGLPAAKQVVHKNGTEWALAWSMKVTKPVASLLVPKNVTKPVAKEAMHKNGTNPGAKEVALLAHKNATKPVVKESGTTPAEKEAVLLLHKNATNSPASHSAHKNGMKPAVKDIAHKNASKSISKNVTKAPSKSLSDEEQISNLQNGLKILANLKPAFTAQDASSKAPNGDLEKFAQGALSTELASKDSPVWAAIQSMLSVTKETAASMTGKSKSEQEKDMNRLKDVLNQKALIFGKVTQKANAIQTQRDDEYLLGVLMEHQKTWSMEQQLNVTKKFADNCEAAKKLLKNYNKSEPLAPQFAALMDQKNATAAAKDVTKKGPAAVHVLAEKTAAKMFLQLVSSFDRVRTTAKRVTKAPTAGKVAKEKAAVKIFLQVVSSFHRVQA